MVCWLGLCMAEAILASSLLQAMPAEHVKSASMDKQATSAPERSSADRLSK